MEDPLDRKVKKEIKHWRRQGKKDDEWVEANLKRLNQIYCGKQTFVLNKTTQIKLPIEKMFLEKGFFMVEGEGFSTGIFGGSYSFNKKYTMIIPQLGDEETTLKIGFISYE